MLRKSIMKTSEGIRKKYVVNLIFFTLTLIRFVEK